MVIEGLTAKQRALADIIWACDGQDQVDAFIRSLPTKDRQQAELVKELMIASFWDTVDHVADDTVELLDKFRI